MDDQNNLDKKNITTVNIVTPPVQNLPVSKEPKKENVTSFTQVDSSTPPPPPIPTVEEISDKKKDDDEKEKPSEKSSSPVVDIPPIVTPPEKPKKKFGGKTIATILGILLLLGGIGTGIFLLKQQQDIRTKAGACCDPPYGGEYNYGGCEAPYYCTYTGVSLCNGGYECKLGEPTPTATGTAIPTPTATGTAIPTPTTKPTTSPPTAQCLNIRVYDTSWNLIGARHRENLVAGDKIRFTVKGTTTSGTFDKARFKINSVVQPITTSKMPDSDKFYIEYTIPSDVTSFEIDAKIHHTSLGWI